MENNKKTMVLVFAGPNGSGKSTVTSMIDTVGEYINADTIKNSTGYSDLDSAKFAEEKRNKCIEEKRDFTFETVLSTDRNLKLLQKAKENDYFIKVYFVLTASSAINIERVASRVTNGGHDVPVDKIISRYNKSLSLLPEVIKVSDICNIIDNTDTAVRIFSKKKDYYRLWETVDWSKERIFNLTGRSEFNEITPCYILLLSDELQVAKLKENKIPYKLNTLTDGRQVALVNQSDKEIAKSCISNLSYTEQLTK